MWWTYHVIISGSLSALYFLFTSNFASSILLFLAGIFIDVDHYSLLYLSKEKSFSKLYKKIYAIAKNGISDNIEEYVLPFHNFEFMILLVIISFFIHFFIPITIGALTHFAVDIIWIRRFKIKNYYSLFYYILFRKNML